MPSPKPEKEKATGKEAMELALLYNDLVISMGFKGRFFLMPVNPTGIERSKFFNGFMELAQFLKDHEIPVETYLSAAIRRMSTVSKKEKLYPSSVTGKTTRDWYKGTTNYMKPTNYKKIALSNKEIHQYGEAILKRIKTNWGDMGERMAKSPQVRQWYKENIEANINKEDQEKE